MAFIFIRERLKKETIRQEFEESLPKIEEWFKNNPKRDECIAQGWGTPPNHLIIRRDHVREDMEKARDEALKEAI